MPTIKIHKVPEEIEYYFENMTLSQARANLSYLKKNTCRLCDEKCFDCIIDYRYKISIEKILEYLDKIIPKRKIKNRKENK